jgi:hypothetical protein
MGRKRDERLSVAEGIGQAPSIGRSAAARRTLRRCHRVRPWARRSRGMTMLPNPTGDPARAGLLKNAAGSDHVIARV